MAVKTYQQLYERLSTFRPKKKWYRRFFNRSAVAIILRENGNGLEALMIKRSEREGDRWSGHMAFPGGRVEREDEHILHTARRETWEEIGLDTDQYTRHHTRLSDIMSPPRWGHKGMLITPHLFTLEELPKLALNYEVDEVIWVPLEYLFDQNNRLPIEDPPEIAKRGLLCYLYEGRQIWGLSLRMLDELIEILN